MRRPIRPIDPNEAEEYERDLDAYERVMEERFEQERDEQEEENNITQNQK